MTLSGVHHNEYIMSKLWNLSDGFESDANHWKIYTRHTLDTLCVSCRRHVDDAEHQKTWITRVKNSFYLKVITTLDIDTFDVQYVLERISPMRESMPKCEWWISAWMYSSK